MLIKKRSEGVFWYCVVLETIIVLTAGFYFYFSFCAQELREMQNRLIQSATEAFGAMDITRSRSNSGCSSNSGSFKSATRSPSITRHAHSRLFRTSSLRLKASTSLHSIQDSETSSSQIPGKKLKHCLSAFSTHSVFC